MVKLDARSGISAEMPHKAMWQHHVCTSSIKAQLMLKGWMKYMHMRSTHFLMTFILFGKTSVHSLQS